MLNFHLKLPRRYFELDVDLSIPSGQIYCLYGPSAAGKSSILSVMAGFETGYDEVTIEVDGKMLLASGPQFEKPKFTPAWQRNVGYLAQSVPLFPHLSVRDNIRFGLEAGQIAAEGDTEAELWYDELVKRLELEPYLHMRPQQLSGGLIQRAALARAMAPRPHLLLLDEPFSALDWQSRNHMQGVVLDLQHRLNMTVILVTHQLEEAQKMADVIGVIDAGQILQQASPSQLMAAPRTWQTAKLLGYQYAFPLEDNWYALHPDKGFVIHGDEDLKYMSHHATQSSIKISGIVHGIFLKDGRQVIQIAVNTEVIDGRTDPGLVHAVLSPLQSVSVGDKVTAYFINAPELVHGPE